MFVFLSKLLPPFIYPLGLACLLILLTVLLTRQHPKRNWLWLQRTALLLSLSLLFFGGNRWVAASLARSLEWRYLPPTEIPQGDVIVLLGGGTLPAEFPRTITEVDGAGDRIIYTAWLYKQGAAPHILVTGGLLDWSTRQSSPAEDMAALLELMGVPREALWLEADSRNTYENALFSARILQEKGVQHALLVTSAFHMHRAVKLFEAQDLYVTPLPTDFSVTQATWEHLNRRDLRAWILDLLPSAGNLALTTIILKEYLGIFTYEIRGWQ